MGGVIAFRDFDREDGKVRLSFDRPRPSPDPELDADPDDPPWRCDFTIEFPDGKVKRTYAMGVDSIQALVLAFYKASIDLRWVGNGVRRPATQWLGMEDLGLSIGHSTTLNPGMNEI